MTTYQPPQPTGTHPFTVWKIDEVIADVVATSAKRFTPDNQREVQKVVDWIVDDFGYYVDRSVIWSAAELLADAQQAHAEHIQSFTEASNLQNWFGGETRSDCLFFWYAVILFYQQLVGSGFTKPHPGKSKVQPVVPFIVHEIRQRLYDNIVTFVDEPERPALAELILNEKNADKPISHRMQQNVLAYIFTQLMSTKLPCIVASQTDVAKWICANFSPATYDTIFDVIRGRKEPTKSKRITINP